MDHVTVRRHFIRAITTIIVLMGTLVASVPVAAKPGAGDISTIEHDDNDLTYVTVEFVAGVRDMANKYGYPVHILVRHIWETPDAVAGTTYEGNIILDEGVAEDPAKFENNAAYNISEGFWPQTRCTPARFVAVHEYGHVIDYHSLGDAEADANAKYFGVVLWGALPDYSLQEDGTIEPGEALANAFAAVECGVGSPIERDLFNILLNSR